MFSLITTHFLVLLALSVAKTEHTNNVCKKWSSYFKKGSFDSCFFDIDAESDAPSVIKRSGYIFENHQIRTADGYILSLFRIPAKGVPVLLVDSYDFSSSCFLALKNDSLAFVLARSGYDVFFLNLSGSRYSQTHVSLSDEDSAFWDYTFDHLALYDLPRALRYIEKLTGRRKILYVGHKSGSTIFLMYSAQFPRSSGERVAGAALIAPLVEMGRSSKRNIVTKELADFSNALWILEQGLRMDKLLSSYKYQSVVIKFLRLYPFLLAYTTHLMPQTAPYYLNSVGGGGSTKLQLHLDQIIAKNSLRMYDYGEEENVNKYGFKHPPAYDYTKIQVPLLTIHAKADKFVNPKDVDVFYSKLTSKAKSLGKLMVEENGFDGDGFLFGVDARRLVYGKILEKFAEAEAESPGSNSVGLQEGTSGVESKELIPTGPPRAGSNN